MSKSKRGQTMHPIAYCPVHGFFPVAAFGLVGGGVKIYMQDLSTNCPTCDGVSEILPGEYEVIGDRAIAGGVRCDPRHHRHGVRFVLFHLKATLEPL